MVIASFPVTSGIYMPNVQSVGDAHIQETEIIVNIRLKTDVLNYISESVTFVCSAQCIYPNTHIYHASVSVCAIQEKKISLNIQSSKGPTKISKSSS